MKMKATAQTFVSDFAAAAAARAPRAHAEVLQTTASPLSSPPSSVELPLKAALHANGGEENKEPAAATPGAEKDSEREHVASLGVESKDAGDREVENGKASATLVAMRTSEQGGRRGGGDSSRVLDLKSGNMGGAEKTGAEEDTTNGGRGKRKGKVVISGVVSIAPVFNSGGSRRQQWRAKDDAAASAAAAGSYGLGYLSFLCMGFNSLVNWIFVMQTLPFIAKTQLDGEDWNNSLLGLFQAVEVLVLLCMLRFGSTSVLGVCAAGAVNAVAAIIFPLLTLNNSSKQVKVAMLHLLCLLLGSCSAVLQGSGFALAAVMPRNFVGAVSAGQGLAGAFTFAIVTASSFLLFNIETAAGVKSLVRLVFSIAAVTSIACTILFFSTMRQTWAAAALHEIALAAARRKWTVTEEGEEEKTERQQRDNCCPACDSVALPSSFVGEKATILRHDSAAAAGNSSSDAAGAAYSLQAPSLVDCCDGAVAAAAFLPLASASSTGVSSLTTSAAAPGTPTAGAAAKRRKQESQRFAVGRGWHREHCDLGGGGEGGRGEEKAVQRHMQQPLLAKRCSNSNTQSLIHSVPAAAAATTAAVATDCEEEDADNIEESMSDRVAAGRPLCWEEQKKNQQEEEQRHWLHMKQRVYEMTDVEQQQQQVEEAVDVAATIRTTNTKQSSKGLSRWQVLRLAAPWLAVLMLHMFITFHLYPKVGPLSWHYNKPLIKNHLVVLFGLFCAAESIGRFLPDARSLRWQSLWSCCCGWIGSSSSKRGRRSSKSTRMSSHVGSGGSEHEHEEEGEEEHKRLGGGSSGTDSHDTSGEGCLSWLQLSRRALVVCELARLLLFIPFILGYALSDTPFINSYGWYCFLIIVLALTQGWMGTLAFYYSVTSVDDAEAKRFTGPMAAIASPLGCVIGLYTAAPY